MSTRTIQVCKSLVVHAGNSPVQYSQALEIGVGNAVLVDFTLVSLAGAGVLVELQQSDDIENWRNHGEPIEARTEGFFQLPTSEEVGAAYLRLRYSSISDGVGVIAARMHITNL